MTPLRSSFLVTTGFALLFVLSVIATHQLFTSKAPGANDFYPRWIGAQRFWRQGIDPYSESTSQAIQQGIYGRLAEPDEDQLLFVYPFYTVFLLLPMVWLPLSYSWIQAIWLVTLQFALLASMLLCLRLIRWQMPAWLLGATLLWTVLFYNSARTIILGQFTALVLLWLTGALLALRRERDLLAGLLLALTTVKPQVTLLLIPAMMLWAFGNRRWRFMIGFLSTILLLFGASFLLLPSWISSFVDQVRFYPQYTVTPPPLWVITGYYLPALGKPVENALSVLLVGYLLFQWSQLPRLPATSDRFLIIVGLTLVITNMIIVRTATTNYVVLYIPLLWGLHRLAKRGRFGHWLVLLFYVLSTGAVWALFLATIDGDFEHPVMYLPLPIGLLVTLVWAKMALRSPAAVRSSPDRVKHI
jgi:hypothetical protein